MFVTQNLFHTDTQTLPGEERDQPAWSRVDLGDSYDVYRVVIYNWVLGCNFFYQLGLQKRKFSHIGISKNAIN